jgi:hypothetical protein
MMPDESETKPMRRRRKRAARPDDPPASNNLAKLFVAGMAGVGLACLAVGSSRHEPELGWFLRSLSYLALGVACFAVGLLELEWLERIVWFVELWGRGLFGWVIASMWEGGTLSESELVGRRRAMVLWVVAGVLVFLWGCLAALRIV